MKLFFKLIFILAGVLKEMFSHEFKVGKIRILDVEPNLESIEFDERDMRCTLSVKVQVSVSNRNGEQLLPAALVSDLDLTALKDKFYTAVKSSRKIKT